MSKHLLITLFILIFLVTGTIVVSFYGRGYRFVFEKGRPDVSGTGLLVTTSSPDGAQVFIDGKLATATNNTINLFPKEYTVRIIKEGFFPWEKTINVQKEVVAKTEALLLPISPKLESVTVSGAENPIIDPSMTKIAYLVSSQNNPKKNGVYILDMGTKPILTLQSASIQITDESVDSFSKASLSWSPDGQELLATISAEKQTPVTYLLKTGGMNQDPLNASEILSTVGEKWAKEKIDKEKSLTEGLKPNLKKAMSKNFKIIAWSPNENKILYKASQSATLPIVITPRLLGVDSTPEDRQLKEGSVYVYDIKEDKNFFISDGKFPIVWFPDSKHLILVNDKKINIMEHDGTNSITVYAGPFVDSFVFPWSNESKILILTNLNNTEAPVNLYTIGLK